MHVYSYSQGKLDEAKPYMEQALAIDKKVHGNEHPDVACGLNNLAQLLSDQVRTFLTILRCLFFVLLSTMSCC